MNISLITRTMTMTMTTPTADDISDLTEADIAALQLSLDLTLSDDPVDPGRVEQITDMLDDPKGLYGNTWRDIANLCCYHQQLTRLNLFPAQSPPCWIVTLDQADAILRKGKLLASDGSGVDVSNCKPARLLKRMLRLGISPFHPNPIKAIAEARRVKLQKGREQRS
jgi:hypothetical protein